MTWFAHDLVKFGRFNLPTFELPWQKPPINKQTIKNSPTITISFDMKRVRWTGLILYHEFAIIYYLYSLYLFYVARRKPKSSSILYQAQSNKHISQRLCTSIPKKWHTIHMHICFQWGSLQFLAYRKGHTLFSRIEARRFGKHTQLCNPTLHSYWSF